MHYYRSQLLKIVNPVVDAIAQNRKKNIEGQMDLFGMGNDEAVSYTHLDVYKRQV